MKKYRSTALFLAVLFIAAVFSPASAAVQSAPNQPDANAVSASFSSFANAVSETTTGTSIIPLPPIPDTASNAVDSETSPPVSPALPGTDAPIIFAPTETPSSIASVLPESDAPVASALPKIPRGITSGGAIDALAAEVFTVALPAEVGMTIDPYNMEGRGQVFSENYTVVNYSDKNVFFSITDTDVRFVNTADFLPLASPETGLSQLKRKEIYIEIAFDDPQVKPMALTAPYKEARSFLLGAAEYDANGVMIPGGNNTLTFKFRGVTNIPLDVPWRPGDVAVNVNYGLSYGLN